MSIPLLAGPGSLTLSILLFSKTATVEGNIAVLSAILAVCLLTLILMLTSQYLKKGMEEPVMKSCAVSWVLFFRFSPSSLFTRGSQIWPGGTSHIQGVRPELHHFQTGTGTCPMLQKRLPAIVYSFRQMIILCTTMGSQPEPFLP
ncbi:MarC family protein [Fodinibius sediminis]|uniref:UPF0056 membrane protein n=1 Tax=Fodinibius sediminis TaxID=1214077 RepID=A0A521DEY5_9BACT|nr:MarC family integral membrane protein [Fodinibius sediminis]